MEGSSKCYGHVISLGLNCLIVSPVWPLPLRLVRVKDKSTCRRKSNMYGIHGMCQPHPWHIPCIPYMLLFLSDKMSSLSNRFWDELPPFQNQYPMDTLVYINKFNPFAFPPQYPPITLSFHAWRRQTQPACIIILWRVRPFGAGTALKGVGR